MKSHLRRIYRRRRTKSKDPFFQKEAEQPILFFETKTNQPFFKTPNNIQSKSKSSAKTTVPPTYGPSLRTKPKPKKKKGASKITRRNRYFGRKLGWLAHMEEIVSYFQALGLLTELETPDEVAFAEAVKDFQTLAGSLTPDGIFGPKTWETLRKVLDQENQSERPEEEEEHASKEEVEPFPVCQLTQFKGTNFIGKTVIADIQFIPALERIDQYAGERGVQIHVNDSFRPLHRKVRGAIVTPAKRSNHLAGHAIDMNVRYNRRLYNSRVVRLKNLNNLPSPVRGFIEDIRQDPGLRWGGNFKREDPVHIDDHLNRSKRKWKERFKATQKVGKSGCS